MTRPSGSAAAVDDVVELLRLCQRDGHTHIYVKKTKKQHFFYHTGLFHHQQQQQQKHTIEILQRAQVGGGALLEKGQRCRDDEDEIRLQRDEDAGRPSDGPAGSKTKSAVTPQCRHPPSPPPPWNSNKDEKPYFTNW